MLEEEKVNVFSALYPFRPREGLSSSENFLTESLVYALKTNEFARNAWLELLLGQRVDSESISIATRAAKFDLEKESIVYPDVEVVGTIDRKPFRAYIEHKWESPCSHDQLKAYAKQLKPHETGFLVFVCQTANQLGVAEQFPRSEFPNVQFKSLSWERVYEALQPCTQDDSITQELLDFMNERGLSPGMPITERTMLAYFESAMFLGQLKRYAEALRLEYQWDFLPERYRESPVVTDSYGRVAIAFYPKKKDPAVSVGFLYDNKDHKVQFTNRSRGIDLVLRFHTEPKNNSESAIVTLRSYRMHLEALNATVRIRGDRGQGNKKTLLIAQRCLAEVISNKDSRREQLDAIYGQLKQWCTALFADGQLESALLLISKNKAATSPAP